MRYSVEFRKRFNWILVFSGFCLGIAATIFDTTVSRDVLFVLTLFLYICGMLEVRARLEEKDGVQS